MTATAAAWWPARSVARLSVTEALSGRPANPKPAHRSVVVAVIAAALGFAGLYFGVDVAADTSNVVLLLAGIVGLVVAIICASPLVLRALAGVASRLPLAPRLALRDLGRYQARAGAAVAAISLGLAISVAIVGIASASEPKESDANLSDRQVLVRTGESFSKKDHHPAPLTPAGRCPPRRRWRGSTTPRRTTRVRPRSRDRAPARRRGRPEHASRLTPKGGEGYGPVTLGRAGRIAHHPRRRRALRRDAGTRATGSASTSAAVGPEVDVVTPQSGTPLRREHPRPPHADPGARHRSHRGAAVLVHAEEPHHDRRRARYGLRVTRGSWLIESA